MKIITITGYRRPHLFAELLDSLIANDLEGWRVNIQIEPSNAAGAFERIAAEKLAGIEWSVLINPDVLGIRENPYRLLSRSFEEGAGLVLYLEEDLLIAKDATELAQWYGDNHRPEWMMLSLLSGGCGSAGFISDPQHPSLLYESKSFNSLGFACRRAEWDRHLRGAWSLDPAANTNSFGGPAPGWDWAVYHHLIRTRGMFSLQPAAARAVHNGREGGEFCQPDWHDIAFVGLDLAMGGGEREPFEVVPGKKLPPQVRRQVLLWEQMNEALEVLGNRTSELATLKGDLEKWRSGSLWRRLLQALNPKMSELLRGSR